MLNNAQTPSVNSESMQLAMYNCRKNLEMQPKKGPCDKLRWAKDDPGIDQFQKYEKKNRSNHTKKRRKNPWNAMGKR